MRIFSMRSQLSFAVFLCISLLPMSGFVEEDSGICFEPALERRSSEEAKIPKEESPPEPASEQPYVEELKVCAEPKKEESEEPYEEPFVEEPEEVFAAQEICDEPVPRWYLEAGAGYLYFTDPDMRQFFDNGGLCFRGEAGYRFWGPLSIWIDGGYFQKEGHSIGGTETIDLKLATITFGLKLIVYLHDRIALYGGAGPRLFMMLMHNNYPYIRSDDNQVGIGGGFDAGLWLFPIPKWPNVFFDLFADYSWKTMKMQEDEISSLDFDVNVSGLTGGLGLGVRF